MSKYSAIKAVVNANIKRNGKKEITGQILNAVLTALIDSLGKYFQFRGVITPADVPGNPDQNVAYIGGAGTYPNFGNLEIASGNIGVFMWDGEWDIKTIPVGKDYDQDIQDLADAIDNLSADVIHLDGVNEEDLIVPEGGRLQFANRHYDSVNPNGLGYKILRKDKTFAEQVTDINTIYEIRYDFDLGGNEVAMPSGCVLSFVGGSISNGQLVFNNTKIEGDFSFDNCVNSGTIDGFANPLFFGAKGDGLNNDTDAIKNCIRDNGVIRFDDGTYMVEHSVLIGSNKSIDFGNAVIKRIVPEVITQNLPLFKLDGVSNTTITGGVFIGDLDSYVMTTASEQGCDCFQVVECNNVTIKGCNIMKHRGDGIRIGVPTRQSRDIYVDGCYLYKNFRHNMSIVGADGVYISNTECKDAMWLDDLDCETGYNGIVNGYVEITDCKFHHPGQMESYSSYKSIVNHDAKMVVNGGYYDSIGCVGADNYDYVSNCTIGGVALQSGSVKVQNCTIERSIVAYADAGELLVVNCRIINEDDSFQPQLCSVVSRTNVTLRCYFYGCFYRSSTLSVANTEMPTYFSSRPIVLVIEGCSFLFRNNSLLFVNSNNLAIASGNFFNYEPTAGITNYPCVTLQGTGKTIFSKNTIMADRIETWTNNGFIVANATDVLICENLVSSKVAVGGTYGGNLIRANYSTLGKLRIYNNIAPAYTILYKANEGADIVESGNILGS